MDFEQLLAEIESEIKKAERLPDVVEGLESCNLGIAPFTDEAGNQYSPNVWQDNNGTLFPGYYAVVSGHTYTVVFRQLPLEHDDRISYVSRKITEAAARYEKAYALAPTRH